MIKNTKKGEKCYDLKGDHRKPFELWAVREEKHWRCPGCQAGGHMGRKSTSFGGGGWLQPGFLVS